MATVMTIGFAGCGKTSTTGTLDEPKGEVAYPETLSIFCKPSDSLLANMEDYNDVVAFQLLEEETGTHIEWTIPPKQGFQEKFNLMVAGGDVKDILCAGWNNLGVSDYIEDGVVVDISPYVPKYMPNFWNFSKEHPELAREYIADGGKVFTIPYIRKDKALNIFYGPVMRTDWLEKLNLEVPTNPDELYTVLKAFKEQDPNGNGIADEIPMTGDTSNSILRLAHMFNTGNAFYVKDNKIKFGIMEPEFKDALTYITKLYSEGLIDVDNFLQDRNSIIQKVTNHKVGFAFEYQPNQAMNLMKDDPTFKFEGIPHFKDLRGKEFTLDQSYTGSVLVNCAAAITTACKEPFGAMKWLDFLYGKKGIEYMNFGVEGETFNYVDGVPTYTEEMLTTEEGKTIAAKWCRNFGSYNSYFPAVQDWYCYSASLNKYGLAAIETWADGVVTDMNLPTLVFSKEENEVIASKFNAIKTYVDESIVKIILGQMSIDELPKVISRVENMGIKEIIDIYQKAFDHYNKKDIGF